MDWLMLIVFLNVNGASTTETIAFESKKLCENARAPIQEEYMRHASIVGVISEAELKARYGDGWASIMMKCIQVAK